MNAPWTEAPLFFQMMVLGLVLAPMGSQTYSGALLVMKSPSTTTPFTESDHQHQFEVTALRQVSGNLVSRIAAGSRTLALFEKRIDMPESATASFSVRFKTLAVKSGIIQPLDFVVSLDAGNSAVPIEFYHQRL